MEFCKKMRNMKEFESKILKIEEFEKNSSYDKAFKALVFFLQIINIYIIKDKLQLEKNIKNNFFDFIDIYEKNNYKNLARYLRGILSIYESFKEDEKMNDLIEFTKKELNDSTENDYSLMNEDLENTETDVESNKELIFSSIIRSNSYMSDSSNNEGSIGLITAIFFALCLSDFGDKSQLAIITMAAIYNIYGILLGSTIALVGTVTLAVLFGKWISEKISPKKLLFIGGIIFLSFGLETLYSIITGE